MLALAFAQEVGQAPQMQQSPLMGLAPVALIFVVFYFLLIRPQKKQQQQHAKMLNELKKNDEVVTSGGIHGTIVNLQDDVVIIRVDENTRMKVQKSAVARVKQRSE
ncbi:MAG: preprotein translocase subunit YajC [Candidatus Omnitrophota bacterium]